MPSPGRTWIAYPFPSEEMVLLLPPDPPCSALPTARPPTAPPAVQRTRADAARARVRLLRVGVSVAPSSANVWLSSMPCRQSPQTERILCDAHGATFNLGAAS